ncbi:MAG: hypothetical protein Q7R47_00630 [Candidatus Diapherotrites archaeon]|nr:hypothetical protein [Candidatus Diapherotrites archaeon]
MKLHIPFIVIGLILIYLSQGVFAFYNPYINNGYSRPYYTQYNSPPGIVRDPYVYGYSYGGCNYGCGYAYAPAYVYTSAYTTNYFPYTSYYASPGSYYAPTVVSPHVVYYG